MTTEKFKKKLTKTPFAPKLFISLFVILILVSILLVFTNLSAIVLLVLSIVGIVFFSKSIKEVKANGKKTIEYLEQNGLLEQVAAEYGSDQKYICYLSEKNGKYNKIGTRKNALTENFVIALSDNSVTTYNEIEEAYIIQYEWVERRNKRRRHIVNDVFTLKTIDGKEIDLFNVYMKIYSKRMTETLETVMSIISEKNPNCMVTSDILEYRGGDA